MELRLCRDPWTWLEAESTVRFSSTDGAVCSEELWPTELPGFAQPRDPRKEHQLLPSASDNGGKGEEQRW